MPLSLTVPQQRIAVIGGGWAGLTAAIRSVQAGHAVTLFEAARTVGGRARGVDVALPSGEHVILDNGQHVLLGAYRETLSLMQTVGMDLDAVLTRLPVTLGMFKTSSWSLSDHLALAGCVLDWIRRGFKCQPEATVSDVCKTASLRVREDVIAALCLSALNTAPNEASGAVFLRVIKDAFMGKAFAFRGKSGKQAGYASRDMLIPKVNLSSLFPSRAVAWLQAHGATVRTGERIASMAPLQSAFDQVVVATPPWEAARLLRDAAPAWSAMVDALPYRAIATVYALAPSEFRLPSAMLALASDAQKPAQFVFQRQEAPGLLAFVISDADVSALDREQIERWVLQQGMAALQVPLIAVFTILERRATFACTPDLKRPAAKPIAQNNTVKVIGDYVDGPYPATIEGAVRSFC